MNIFILSIILECSSSSSYQKIKEQTTKYLCTYFFESKWLKRKKNAGLFTKSTLRRNHHWPSIFYFGLFSFGEQNLPKVQSCSKYFRQSLSKSTIEIIWSVLLVTVVGTFGRIFYLLHMITAYYNKSPENHLYHPLKAREK